MIATYGMQETHSTVLVQRPIWSYKQAVRASMELADEKKRLPTGKKPPLCFRLLFLLDIFIDKGCKDVGKGTEIKATQVS